MKKLYIVLAILVALGSPLSYYLLEPSVARLLLMIILATVSFLLSYIIASSRKMRREVMVLCVLLLILMIYILPVVRGGLILFLRKDLVNEQLLLFNHEISYDPLGEKLIFFQSSNHHVYYPASYALAKIVFDVTNDAYLVELVLFPAVSAILFFGLLWALIRKIDSQSHDSIRAILVYCSSLLLLSFHFGGVQAYLGIWWFRSVASLSILVLLLLFVHYEDRATSDFLLVFVFFIPMIILSDSFYQPLSLMLFLAYSYYLTKKERFLRQAILFLIAFLVYQTFIGFVSYLWYRDFLRVMANQLQELLAFSRTPQSLVSEAVIERQTIHSDFDKLSFAVSYALVHVIIPTLLCVYLMLKGIRWQKVLPLFLMVLIAASLQIGARLTPVIFVADVGVFLTYGPLTFMTISLGLYTDSTSRKLRWSRAPSSFRQRLDKRHLWFFVSLIILFSSAINSVSLIYPKSIQDPIEFVDDPRVSCYDTWFVADFLNAYWDGKSSVSYHISLHAQDFFLKEEIPRDRASEIITVPAMQTIFRDRAEDYERIDISSSMININYHQGRWLIVTTNVTARL